jgi:DNA polymerase/3'-5' exonuclease PolX
MNSHKNDSTKRLVIILHYGINFVDKKISIYMKILMQNGVPAVVLRNIDDNLEEKRKFKKQLQKYNEIVLLVDSFLTYDNVMRRLESTCTRLKTIIESKRTQIVAYSQECFQAIQTKQPNLKMFLLTPGKSLNSHTSTSIITTATNKPNHDCDLNKKRKYVAVEETTLPPLLSPPLLSPPQSKYPSLCIKRKTTVDNAKKNQHIISKFVEYYNYTKAYKTSHQQIQGFTLPRVISILRGLTFQITHDNANELENINYISKRYVGFIFEILEKGSFERLELMRCNPKANACLNFVKIYNIGSSKANELYNLGYRSIRQLKADVFNSTGPIAGNNQVALKETLTTSLTFFDDSQHNYTLQERQQFASKIKIIAKRLNLKMEICGGTRRLKKLGHDLDLLFTTNEVFNKDAAVFDVRDIGKQLLEEVKRNFYEVQLLKHDTGSFTTSDTLPESREERHSIQLTVIKETEASHYRRVDFVCVPPRHWVFAVLGWTGTTMFERSLRTVCILSRFPY